MSFSIRDLFYTILLVLNGLAILNEERFLARIGWSTSQVSFSGNESVKAKLLSLISAVRTLLRLPLIVVNSLVILYALTIG
ncbi:hypothetical protein DSO57_1030241 [Entomophthora muscae]|uniref:Uncharacterized protein n=1 Tax=Entomophthora muscae TaxID=34485 RepID=A0ACC2SQ13_9FUNG|nr:hypothetical protein DSO57_1030241 [Entomophthora muscae]